MIGEIGAGILILILVCAAVGCIWGAVVQFGEGDLICSLVIGGTGFALIAILLLAVGAAQEDSKNPCIAWGPPVTTYVMVGKMMIPSTTTPCVRRQNEVER